jgi:hypothetical protein
MMQKLALLCISFVVGSCADMSYDEALQLANRNHVDDGVLAAFDREHARVGLLGDLDRLAQVKVNLGAALIDAANKKRDYRQQMKMYRHSKILSIEALEIQVRQNWKAEIFVTCNFKLEAAIFMTCYFFEQPENEAAIQNLRNSKKNLKLLESTSSSDLKSSPSVSFISKCILDTEHH